MLFNLHRIYPVYGRMADLVTGRPKNFLARRARSTKTIQDRQPPRQNRSWNLPNTDWSLHQVVFRPTTF